MLENIGQEFTDSQAMALALEAARCGQRGANPLVGAVVLSPENRVLSLGWHRGAGTPHAEADALIRARQIGTDLRGARMLVTLEPCNHTGRTGPCSHAVADAGIGELIFAYADTTAEASGGADYLRSRGVKVNHGLMEREAYELNARWFAAAAGRRPFITAKIASSLDGFIAAADGSSQWITGPEARADGHALRARVDAILVGTGTVKADNPQLTARIGGQLAPRQPLRSVMGHTLPPHSYLATEIAAGTAVHLATRDPNIAVAELYGRGVRHLMIEGGPTVVSAFLAAGLVDELIWYRAPLLLGAGRAAVTDLGVDTLSQAQHWQLDDLGLQPALRQLGADTATHLLLTDQQGTPAPSER
ncbi:bifunctional diaminohydroxyphosphoribosylaminopyrimidine deaminase/5-amino-6-(5-phosphoribosylamino)uracil reductase RibD [Rothia endophytica]|uniref:bifunctional diaminohydroxyphosphoribosylaminopyrimidine deaminase/5-amino-6-(5-phosphoribosylamino)uracil reductase RibD n=1 Tax=Rothia endophytica TaxID=1324766 RepID=UPI001F03084B|nr:bifunctional diaminohydroxyphosphoribosylaminopyrimidine deaminase/5-amino-6-(5-phosphoribosylamino)uracil reductase RibD [Rothia endophytica]